MIPAWCEASVDSDAILITVASTDGSVPREAGAKMLVTVDALFDTIGGGHLELSALEVARAMLAQPAGAPEAQRRLLRMALGPTLGQCCGGVVYLAFERITVASQDQRNIVRSRWHQGLKSWRLTALDQCIAPVLFDADGNCIAGSAESLPMVLDFSAQQSCQLQRDQHGGRWLLDPLSPYRAHLLLFGAGHVGAAIINVLSTLPCHVTWIDSRAEQFPQSVPANITVEVNEFPEDAIDAAPIGASFLVMTHSHPLDLRLAQRILARDDVGWFGLIGSRTKRIQFERRLRTLGITEARLTEMVCPIGIDGIDGKEPAVLAIAVVAQLLQVWQAQAAAVQPNAITSVKVQRQC